MCCGHLARCPASPEMSPRGPSAHGSSHPALIWLHGLPAGGKVSCPCSHGRALCSAPRGFSCLIIRLPGAGADTLPPACGAVQRCCEPHGAWQGHRVGGSTSSTVPPPPTALDAPWPPAGRGPPGLRGAPGGRQGGEDDTQISGLRKYPSAFQKIESNGMEIRRSDYGYCSVDVLPGVSSRREINLCFSAFILGLRF